MALSPETGKPDRFLPPQHQHRHGRQGSPQHLLNRHWILPKVQGQCPGCLCFLSSTRRNSERKEHLEREKVESMNVILSDLNRAGKPELGVFGSLVPEPLVKKGGSRSC